MKYLKNILGLSLVAALMIVASNRVQAGAVVFDDQLYTPLNLSVSATFDVNGKNKKANITEKDIISILGLGNVDLVINYSDGDVYTMNAKTKEIGENLTEEGFLTISNVTTGSSVKGDKTTYVGTAYIDIYDEPSLNGDGSVDVATSETDSDDWIELSGTFKGVVTAGPVSKKGVYEFSNDYTTKDVAGNVFAGQISSDLAPAKGNVSSSGSGSLTP